jgi:hypothetical protein
VNDVTTTSKPITEHLNNHEVVLQDGMIFRIKGKRVKVVHEQIRMRK